MNLLARIFYTFFGSIALALACVSMGIEIGRDLGPDAPSLPSRSRLILLTCGAVLISLSVLSRKEESR